MFLPDELFDALRRSSCPYASHGRYVLGAEWDGVLPTSFHLDCLAHTLDEAAGKPTEERTDAVVAVFRHADTLMTSQHLCRALFTCLAGLRSRDQFAAGDLIGDLLRSLDSWDFTFGSVAYFTPVFSSMYEADHPRMCDLPDTSYILFQPEYAFRRFNISGGRPRRRMLSEQVLSRFASDGRRYPIESVLDWPKVYRYVKPIRYDDGPVPWWSVGQGGDLDGRLCTSVSLGPDCYHSSGKPALLQSHSGP